MKTWTQLRLAATIIYPNFIIKLQKKIFIFPNDRYPRKTLSALAKYIADDDIAKRVHTDNNFRFDQFGPIRNNLFPIP